MTTISRSAIASQLALVAALTSACSDASFGPSSAWLRGSWRLWDQRTGEHVLTLGRDGSAVLERNGTLVVKTDYFVVLLPGSMMLRFSDAVALPLACYHSKWYHVGQVGVDSLRLVNGNGSICDDAVAAWYFARDP